MLQEDLTPVFESEFTPMDWLKLASREYWKIKNSDDIDDLKNNRICGDFFPGSGSRYCTRYRGHKHMHVSGAIGPYDDPAFQLAMTLFWPVGY